MTRVFEAQNQTARYAPLGLLANPFFGTGGYELTIEGCEIVSESNLLLGAIVSSALEEKARPIWVTKNPDVPVELLAGRREPHRRDHLQRRRPQHASRLHPAVRHEVGRRAFRADPAGRAAHVPRLRPDARCLRREGACRARPGPGVVRRHGARRPRRHSRRRSRPIRAARSSPPSARPKTSASPSSPR